MKNITVRQESNTDIDDIRQGVFAAFENHPHSNQTEHLLVEKLREAGALSISLVAEVDSKVIGHIAFSPVSIHGEQANWYGLAPVSVHPAWQRQGIGRMLIQAGLAELHKLGAAVLCRGDVLDILTFCAIIRLCHDTRASTNRDCCNTSSFEGSKDVRSSLTMPTAAPS